MVEPATPAEAMHFGDVLRRYRIASGLTQEALAARSGLSTRGVSDLERGRRIWPRKETVRLLISALALSGPERAEFLQAARRPATPRAESPRPAETPAADARIAPSLPMPALPVIGRVAELAQVRQLLCDPQTRLLTLTGIGGVGKTRLAVEIARDVAEAFADGVVFVDLAPLRDPDLVLPTIASVLDLQEVGGRSPLPLLVTRLHKQRMLLILDNAEHLLPAAPALAALIAATVGPTLLVTCRSPLHLHDEREFLVRPLPVPDADEDAPLPDLTANAAVALFLQRATLCQHNCALTTENAGSVAAICRRLEGLPLAIELAASWVKVMRPDALLARLDQRLPLLTGGPRDVPDRQRTLRDTIAWSYELLGPMEQALLRQLAIFAGGWSLAAAQAVIDPHGAADVLGGLAALVDRNLILPVDAPTADPRFTMLETVREFAQEQLTACDETPPSGRGGLRGEEGRLRHAHAHFFLGLAEQADTQIEMTPDILPGLEQGQTDHDNLRAALATFIDEQDTDAAQRLAGALGLFWYHRGFWSEGRAWLERVLALPGSAAPATRAKVLCRFGLFAHVQGEEARAIAAFEDGLGLAQSIDDRAAVANAQFSLGFIALDAGDYETGRRQNTSAFAFYQELGDPFWLALVQLHLGIAAAGLGAVEEAERYWDSGLANARAVGDPWSEAVIEGEHGWLLCQRSAYREAAASLERSLRQLHEMGCMHDLCRFLPYVAALAASSGHVDQAARLYGGITDAYERLGFTPKPVARARTETVLATIRAQLSAEAYAAAWTDGQAMRWSDLVEDALSLSHRLATEDWLVPAAAGE